MTMAPIGSERAEHVLGREFGNQGQFVVSRWWCEEMVLMQSLGTVLPPLLLYLLWLLPLSWTASEALTPVWRDELQNHTFLHTMFCQAAAPNLGLSETYDGDLLFSFNFDQTTRVPRLPEFAAWAQESQDISNILFDKVFCSMLVEQVGPKLEGKIPVSRGIPVAEVFTLKPLEFGKPNTLVCYISNLFPPTLTVNWQYNSAPVEGTGPTFISAVDGLSFQAFSYLNITPAASDLYACIVTHEIDSLTAIAYWVPRNALPSDLLENVLCGVAFALGVLGIMVGLSLITYYQRPCSGGMLGTWGLGKLWEPDPVAQVRYSVGMPGLSGGIERTSRSSGLGLILPDKNLKPTVLTIQAGDAQISHSMSALLLLLLGLSLGCTGAGGFIAHVESTCVLDDDGMPQEFTYCISFNKDLLTCWNQNQSLMVPCEFGTLFPLADSISKFLNTQDNLLQRLSSGLQDCATHTSAFWRSLTHRIRPPSVQVAKTIPFNTKETVMLACYVWGFYPSDVTITWRKNGEPVLPHNNAHKLAQPNGDWTYQTVSYLATSPSYGDTYICVVEHVGTPEPILQYWTSGLSLIQTVKVCVSAVTLSLGFIVFSFGFLSWKRVHSS
ncbi:HLA class II histocompatibility antigen, DM beta chain, partial [Galemys pyrenaicus]